MYQNKFSTIVIFCIVILFSACASNEIGNSKDVNQETIYQEYHVSYSEGDEQVKVSAQFRFAGKNGTTLVLTNPSKIAFDEKIIPVDSTEVRGAYYETSYPVNNYSGTHRFCFTDINKQKFDNEYNFSIFKLTDVPSVASKNQALQIPFTSTALGTDDLIEIYSVDTDSSFSISHTANDSNAFIEIPLSEMKRQQGKELSIGVSLIRKLPLKNTTKEGGNLEIEYHLKPVKIELGNSLPVSLLTVNN